MIVVRRAPLARRARAWDRFQVRRCALGPALFALAFATSACGGSRDKFVPGPEETPAARVDFSVRHQRISGFGASSAWVWQEASDSLADQFFSTETGIGLSLLRIRITPSGDTWELQAAHKAIARGAQVWAAPWSPPGVWKTNGSDVNGGALLPARRGDWAQRLVDFVTNLANVNVPLVYISAQNEPNWVADWETCEWTPAELTAFIRDEFGPRLAATGLATKILAPETNDWNTIANFGNALLNDATASSFVGAIATHAYGGRAFAYSAPADRGKEFWQTEISDDDGPRDTGMNSALRVAGMIHEHLTLAEVNAWHYWWLVPGEGTEATGNPGLTDGGRLTRRAYALGNFSRFVRPGFERVTATNSPLRGVFVSAYQAPDSGRFAVLAINSNSEETPLDFTLGATDVARVTPFVTSDTLALEPTNELEVDPTDGRFSAVLAARSVTTFVGGE